MDQPKPTLIQGYFGISGIIGVGKSTLTIKLAKALGFEPVREDAFSNPYLPKFYKDMNSYVFRMQIWFLNHRMKQHRELAANLRAGEMRGIIKDRTVWEDKVFAKMFNKGYAKLLSDLDYRTYLDIFDGMMGPSPAYPQLLIHLDCAPETALSRVRRRGRRSEREAVDIDYLKALSEAYEAFLEEMKNAGVPILRLNLERFMPVAEIVNRIRRRFGDARGPSRGEIYPSVRSENKCGGRNCRRAP